MGNCAIKPKVLKDSDEDLIPVERDTTVHNKDSGEKSKNNAPNAADEEAAAARRSEKGKEILIEDDAEDGNSKRQSLSLLFHEVNFHIHLSKSFKRKRCNPYSNVFMQVVIQSFHYPFEDKYL